MLRRLLGRRGYTIHGISDLLGFLGLFGLLGTGAYLGYRYVVGTLQSAPLWLLAASFGLAALGAVLYRVSWPLARRKGFRYDPDSREASWLEGGERRTYRHE